DRDPEEPVIDVEVDNRSDAKVDEEAAVELARAVLEGEGVGTGELGLAFVGPDESRALKREHLGVDEATDALAFPIDGLSTLPDGVPRQLGDVVVFAGAIAVGVTRLQLIALVLAIAFVLVAEMLNTAIEGIIDVSTTSFDPNAKLAKDIAAGAVLIAAVTAVAIGFLVFQSAVG